MTGRKIFREAALRRHLQRPVEVHFPALKKLSFKKPRVPVIPQMTAGDCGAACLAMIAGYHGRNTTLDELTHLAGGIGRDGLSARQLADIARRCGLRARGLSIEDEHLEKLELPAIAHWRFNHFVVLEEVDAARATIVDPGAGRMTITREEFLRSFTGVVLTFAPGEDFARRRGTERKPWRDYFNYLLAAKGSRALFGQVLLTSLLFQVLGLVFPIATAVIVDEIIPLRQLDLLPLIGAALLVLVFSQATVFYLRAVLLIQLRGRVDTHLMLGFFEHVLTLPFRFFETRTSGDLIQRLNSNSTLREALTGQTLSTVLDGGFVLLYLSLLWTQDVVFGAVTTFAGGLQILLLISTRAKVKEQTQRHLASQAASQSYLVESLGGMETIKAMGAEQRVFEYWSSLFYKQLNVSLERDQLAAMVHSIIAALTHLAPLVLVWAGAGRVLAGALSLGTMLGLMALAAAFLAPLSSLVSSGQALQMLGAHLARIADVIETAPEQEADRVASPGTLSGRIELRGVSFRYSADGPEVLEKINLSIAPGTKLALVGATGSGKSTLARLLLGLYEPTEGEIFYDGSSLRTLDYRQVRAQLGAVMQDTFLFSGSIRDNISLSDPHISMNAVVEAARAAQIAEEIEAMPMGYETLIAENGSGLSGGQRQRIAIARALVRKPSVLLFDEATSHLDTLTERRIDGELRRFAATRIVVAHRLSTVLDADVIAVLHAGRIVELGDHRELLRANGLYARMMAAGDAAAGSG